MKNNDISISKHTLKYGLILGSIITIFNCILYWTDNFINKNYALTITSTLIIILGIILGIMTFKRKNNSYIKLSQAFKIGLVVSLLGGIVGIIWFILLYNVFDPEITSEIEAYQMKNLIQHSTEFTQEQIDKKKELAKIITSPLTTSLLFFAEHLFHGVIISFVVGLIVQKKKEPVLD